MSTSSSFLIVPSNRNLPIMVIPGTDTPANENQSRFSSSQTRAGFAKDFVTTVTHPQASIEKISRITTGRIIANILILVGLLALATGLFALVMATPISFVAMIVASVLAGLTVACFLSSLVSLILTCLDYKYITACSKESGLS